MEDHKDIFHDAVLGTVPRMEDMDFLTRRGLGQLTGGFVDRWDWNRPSVYALSRADAETLYRRLKGAERL